MPTSGINDVVEFDFTRRSLQFGFPLGRNGAIWVTLGEGEGGDLVSVEDLCTLRACMSKENVIVFRSVLSTSEIKSGVLVNGMNDIPRSEHGFQWCGQPIEVRRQNTSGNFR